MNKKTALLLFASVMAIFGFAISYQTLSDIVPAVILFVAGLIAGYNLRKS